CSRQDRSSPCDLGPPQRTYVETHRWTQHLAPTVRDVDQSSIKGFWVGSEGRRRENLRRTEQGIVSEPGILVVDRILFGVAVGQPIPFRRRSQLLGFGLARPLLGILGVGGDSEISEMAQAVEEWYKQMPIITRSYLTAAVVTTVGCSLEIISPYNLYLNPKLIVQQYEIWRLVTNFLYFRKMGRFKVLLGFSILVGSSTWVDLLGMIAGHVYYFLEDVYPQMTGRRPLKTPLFIKAIFADDDVLEAQPGNERFAPPAQDLHQDQ
ncbi:hypothetical protein BHE74_00009378, partial [Ensete ventricosum]